VTSGFLCAAGSEEKSNATTQEEFYVFLPKSLDNPYWDDCRKGMEATMAELGIKAEFLGPATSDSAKQVEIFESVIARKPAGIAVSPNDPATVTESIRAAMAAGIPVITWDADAPNSERIAYVGTNNVNAGRTAGEEMVKLIGEKGEIAILHGTLSAANAIERVDGFMEVINKYPNIKVVAVEPTEESVATALSKAESLLQAYPNLKAFYGVTGAGVPGGAAAVLQAGKAGKVLVLGFDVVPQGIELMKAGAVQVLISQKPYGMTQDALNLMYGMKRGEKPTQEFYDTGVAVVYPNTLDQFLSTPH
jgi:ABC-type sugar transport system substrate-binding protein